MSAVDRGRRRRGAVAATAALALALTPTVADAASSTLRTGFMDDAVLNLPAAERGTWLNRATGVGAGIMRVNLYWRDVAPQRPADADAGQAAWSGYAFGVFDAQVKAARAAGMDVLLNVSRAPAWAEGPDKDPKVDSYPGNWKPDAAAFGRFMSAVAQRYSGATPDPAAPGQMLPQVDDFQLWNEPNLNLYLAPQYESGKPFAPVRWREMVNAGYTSIKAARPTANVVAAGLAPFGDPASATAQRTRPVAFLRTALCLSSSLKKTCGDVTRVDTISLHPYAVDRPGRAARDPDDATIPDLARITKVVRAGRKAGTVGPKLPRTWVTEVSYDSGGPDPKGVPLATRARYISETMWRVWRAGAEAVVWYLMRDNAPEPSYEASYQSGMFYLGGKAKSDAPAFRFPLLVTGRTSSRLTVWLRTPTAAGVRVQVRRNGRWATVTTKRLRKDGVATVKVPRSGVTGVRAVAGSTRSYVWKVG